MREMEIVGLAVVDGLSGRKAGAPDDLSDVAVSSAGEAPRTLPPLFLRPGSLARDHFEGRRQRHVPPFRLFLITLLIFMFALEISTHKDTFTHLESHPAGAAQPADATAKGPFVVKERAQGTNVVSTRPASEAEITSGFDEMQKSRNPMVRWFGGHGRKAALSQEHFRALMFEWGHRLAILLLPILAGFLTLFYCYRRKFFVYDHLVVSMHFLSFVFLLWGVVALLPPPIKAPAVLLGMVWTPVNLFMTLRGAYGSSIAGAAVKAVSLWLATLMLFVVLLLGVMAAALQSM